VQLRRAQTAQPPLLLLPAFPFLFAPPPPSASVRALPWPLLWRLRRLPWPQWRQLQLRQPRHRRHHPGPRRLAPRASLVVPAAAQAPERALSEQQYPAASLRLWEDQKLVPQKAGAASA
jgi:hypothetical protein